MGTLAVDAHVYNRGEEEGRLSDEVAKLAATAEEMGFDAAITSETDSNPFLPQSLIAEHTDSIEMGTRIALAFTRSPMNLAYTAWNLAQYSDGRFLLGLGTQVRAHNRRRFSVESQPPGPRLREVIDALRHIWDVFQGEATLDFDGEYYSFSLLPDFFDPGPIDDPEIPIHIAGVNEYNLRLAGEKADGLCMHPFNSPEYIEDVIVPTVTEGADRADRSLEDVDLNANPLVITGQTDEEIAKSRAEIRHQIAFYASTPSYRDVLAHHGWESVGRELHELSREDKFDEMPRLVTDEMVDTFAIQAPVDRLGHEIRETYEDLADRVMLYDDFDGADYWETIVSDIKRPS